MSITTDMKTEKVQPTVNGKKVAAWECQLTRESADSFVVESLDGSRDVYKTSADGQTLTFRRIPGKNAIVGGRIDSNGVLHKVEDMRVFDRVQ